ncbi:MAG: hypothetical protein HYY21_09200 [Candidatus Tectomicrobia bacterium]|nr:hypothetical protein [Candidatus Tectomicrobia bacterium]
MKASKVFKTTVLTTLLLAGAAGVALAQDRLVSGVPYEGFLEGVLIQANGPVVADQVVIEAPSRLVEVERHSIRSEALDATTLAELYPEAFIGRPVEAEAAGTTIARAN